MPIPTARAQSSAASASSRNRRVAPVRDHSGDHAKVPGMSCSLRCLGNWDRHLLANRDLRPHIAVASLRSLDCALIVQMAHACHSFGPVGNRRQKGCQSMTDQKAGQNKVFALFCSHFSRTLLATADQRTTRCNANGQQAQFR